MYCCTILSGSSLLKTLAQTVNLQLSLHVSAPLPLVLLSVCGTFHALTPNAPNCQTGKYNLLGVDDELYQFSFASVERRRKWKVSSRGPWLRCCRRFCVINWCFWGSSVFIAFQSPCTSSGHICTCFPLWAAANWAPPKPLLIPSDHAQTHTHSHVKRFIWIR